MNEAKDPVVHLTEDLKDSSEENLDILRSVTVTKQEFDALGTADVDSEAVVSFMEQNGLEFGQDIIVKVSGSEDIVVKTDKEDFFTRDKEATIGLSLQDTIVDSAEFDSSIDEQVARDMGELALNDFALPAEVVSEVGESEEEAEDKESNQDAIDQFEKYIGQIEESVRLEVDNYKGRSNEALDSLKQIGLNTGRVFEDIQGFLNRAMYGSIEPRVAINMIVDSLPAVRASMRNDLVVLDELKSGSIRLDISINEQKDGELAQKKQAIESVSGDEAGESLEHAGRLDASLIGISGVLNRVKHAISATEDANSTQLSLLNRLTDIASQLQSRANQGQVGEADFDELNYITRLFRNEFEENNGSRINKIKNTIEELTAA